MPLPHNSFKSGEPTWFYQSFYLLNIILINILITALKVFDVITKVRQLIWCVVMLKVNLIYSVKMKKMSEHMGGEWMLSKYNNWLIKRKREGETTGLWLRAFTLPRLLQISAAWINTRCVAGVDRVPCSLGKKFPNNWAPQHQSQMGLWNRNSIMKHQAVCRQGAWKKTSFLSRGKLHISIHI